MRIGADVSQNRKIVAWARWHSPRKLSEAEKAMGHDPDLFEQDIPEGANVPLCEDLFEKLEWAEGFVDREDGFCSFVFFISSYYFLRTSI
jgi:hypothetical protein